MVQHPPKRRKGCKRVGRKAMDGALFLDPRKMRRCRKDIKYSDKTIRMFVEQIGKPSLQNKTFVGKIYKGHMLLVILNYCSTQYSEVNLQSKFDIKRVTSIKNIKIGSEEISRHIREKIWNPKITSEYDERHVCGNKKNTKAGNFSSITWMIDGNRTRTEKFKMKGSDGNMLNKDQLAKCYYDTNLDGPGKKFIGLRGSNGKWRGLSKSCYPSGRYSDGYIIKKDIYCKKWFSLMNPNDCVETNFRIGPSVVKLLKESHRYYGEDEEDPKIDETRITYAPEIKENYPSKMQLKLETMKREHQRFQKKNIKKAWNVLKNNNPSIISDNVLFRKDDGVLLSNLIQVSMEMQNIEDGLTEEEREDDDDGEHEKFMNKLYNGDISFKEEEEEADDDVYQHEIFDVSSDEEEKNMEKVQKILIKREHNIKGRFNDHVSEVLREEENGGDEKELEQEFFHSVNQSSQTESKNVDANTINRFTQTESKIMINRGSQTENDRNIVNLFDRGFKDYLRQEQAGRNIPPQQQYQYQIPPPPSILPSPLPQPRTQFKNQNNETQINPRKPPICYCKVNCAKWTSCGCRKRGGCNSLCHKGKPCPTFVRSNSKTLKETQKRDLGYDPQNQSMGLKKIPEFPGEEETEIPNIDDLDIFNLESEQYSNFPDF